MNPPTLISVSNHSTHLSDADGAKIVDALCVQLSRDYAPFYGPAPALEYVLKGKSSAHSDAVPFVISDKATVPGAAGYHDESSKGQPRGFVFVEPILSNGGTILQGGNSVSAALSHEALELMGDVSANLWADGPEGDDFARELSDAVEADSYVIDGVSVSNFVLPSFFDPNLHAGRFDFMSKLHAPFSMSAGGYQIKRTEPGNVSQVFARAGFAGQRSLVGIYGAGRRVVIVDFSPEFPAHKRAAKIERARGRRCGKRVA